MPHIPSPDSRARACAVCGRVLAHAGGYGYRHSEQDIAQGKDDHLAVPVRYEDVGANLRPRCDFCSSEWPTYVVYSCEITLPYGAIYERKAP